MVQIYTVNITTILFSESSQAAKNGGCFAGNSTVEVAGGGTKLISDLRLGDEVASYDGDKIVYSEVIMFLDRNPEAIRQFFQITTNTTKLKVTPQHLLIKLQKDGTLVNTFAARILSGDMLMVTSNLGEIHFEKVIEAHLVIDKGIYAPLTKVGTVVVDKVVVSCYAVIESQTIAHIAFAPVRLYYDLKEGITKFYNFMIIHKSSVRANETAPVGVPWYPKLLYKFSSYFAPKYLMYDTSDVNDVKINEVD